MRLFVSVPIPPELRERIAILGSEIAREGIVTVKPGNMHLTLRFIGEARPQDLEPIRKKLSAVKFRRFDCRICGVGAFPDENFIKVVWVGVQSGGALEALAGDVATALEGFGKDELFTAHITLARVKRKADLRSFIEKYRTAEFGAVRVDHFELMESRLGRDTGPEYFVVERFDSEA